MKKPKLLDPVRITWEDAWSDSFSRYTVESIQRENPYVGKSVGFLIRNDKSGMSIGREVFQDRFRDVQHIPRSLIRKVEVLDAGQTRKMCQSCKGKTERQKEKG